MQKYEHLTSKKEAIKNKIDERLKLVFDETVYNEKGFVQKGDDSLWGKIKYHLPNYKKPFYTSLLLAVDGVVFGFLLSLVLLAVKNKSTLSRTNNVFVKGVKQVGSKFVDFYVWLLNGVPIAAQGLLVWFARHLWWPSIFATMHQTHAALVVIVLNSAANIAVVLMQTLKFVDKGQVEAAQSLGFNKKQTFYYVTF